jgi:hypothetical protein
MGVAILSISIANALGLLFLLALSAAPVKNAEDSTPPKKPAPAPYFTQVDNDITSSPFLLKLFFSPLC